MANKTDCFAYTDTGTYGPRGVKGCRALSVLDCNNCDFYKTNEQVEEEKKAVEARHKKVGWMKGDKE